MNIVRKILRCFIIAVVIFSSLAMAAMAFDVYVDGGQIGNFFRITTNKFVVKILGMKRFIICDTFTSAGIQACINELDTSIGGEIELPAGDYDVTSAIIFPCGNITISGAGLGTRLLATNRFVYGTVTGTPASGNTLTGATTGYTATCVKVDTTNKVVWYRTISNAANFNSGEVINWSGGAATTLVGAPTEQNFTVLNWGAYTQNLIRDLQIVGGAGGGNSGVYAITGTGNYNFLSNVSLSYMDDYGIYVTTGSYNFFRNIRFNANDGVGAYVWTSYSVVNSLISQSNGGIAIHGRGAYCNISNCNIGFNGDEGIYIQGDYSVCNGNSVIRSANGKNDIKCVGAYVSITGNTTESTTNFSERGIYLSGSGAHHCVVTGNTSKGHDTCGIQVDSDCANTTLGGNNCSGETTPYVNNGTSGQFRINENVVLDKTIIGNGLVLPHLINKVASANVRNSHDVEATSTSATYTKVKTITLSYGLVGQQRFLFDIKTSDSGTPETAYGKIYRNGVALGTEQTDITGSYVTKSEDITQTWNPGDTCELWVKIGNGDTVSVQNFRIAYDDSPTVTVSSTNS